MSVDTKLKELIINTLSPEQLPEQPSETEIYLVEDDAEYATVEELAEKQDKLTAGAGISIDDNNVISASGAVESVNGKTGTVVLTGEDIAADVSELTDTVQGHLQALHDKVQDIELFKFPNATIIGEPVIQSGQVSGFSVDNYLQFPFIVDLHNQPFVIDFCFTTGDDVTTQQNILDSQFGLALAISNGKGLMAISHNGTSWAGSVVGTMDIDPYTTYYARLSWNRINYQTQLSTDGTTYTPDMNFGSTQAPYPRTMFIGGCSGSAIGHTPHPFKGTINMNDAYLTVSGNVIWQGMDDAGLATRADVSLDNLDEFGQAKVDSTKNKNEASAINRIYDWVGTLQEAIDQDVRALHPDWKIYITDDVSGGESVYTKNEVDEKFVMKSHEVIAFQAPTAENNYTWYRKYADGWVEQGGNYVNNTSTNTFNLPITMSDTNYLVLLNAYANMASHILYITSRTTTSVSLYHGDNKEVPFSWQVSGMAA